MNVFYLKQYRRNIRYLHEFEDGLVISIILQVVAINVGATKYSPGF
jgi:hypothetical protein